MITVNQLSKKYGATKVLDNIDLLFKKGRISGVVGANGAGKTTLFRCIAGMESYDGTIGFDQGILKNVTGFLETNPYLMSKITGEEYLQLLCDARNIDVPDLGEKNLFELPLKKYAETYSTGMKKKLALTGILLQQNEVFILDEPFNGIDIGSNLIITALLSKLKALHKTVILSSHIFGTLQDTCDHLFYLKDGKLAKSVEKGDFKSVEEEMKTLNILDKIEKMNLK